MRPSRFLVALSATLALTLQVVAQPAPDTMIPIDRMPSPTANQIKLPTPGGGGGGGTPTPAPASGLVNAVTPQITARLLKDVGFSSVDVVKINDSEAVQVGIDDVKTIIWHENCQQGVGCTVLWFMVNFGKQDTINQKFMDVYNARNYYSKLFLNQNGEAVMSMGATTFRGVSEDHIKGLGQIWISVFKSTIAFDPSK